MIAENDDINVINSYSRYLAFENGVLTDLSHSDAVREHWKYPLACTETVWNCIEIAIRKNGDDLNGILHNISTLAKRKIATRGDTNLVTFYAKIDGCLLHLKLHLGFGDNREPVMTLMLADED